MIRIITDSTSDISQQKGADMGIDIIPLLVHFGEEAYRDGIDISNEEFYKKLQEADTLPTTSQLNPFDLEAVFKKYISKGDDVIGIFISSELSGTYQSAVIAKNSLDSDHIFLIDSKNVTFGLALLIEEAVIMRDQGKTAEEIAGKIEELKSRVRLYAAVDTLKYLKMGGRISSSTAIIGSVLGINPIVSIEHGKVESVGKVRGRKAAFRWLLEKMKEDAPDFDYSFFFGHTNAPEVLSDCIEFITPHVDSKNVKSNDIGVIVGTHAGPGAVGIAYIAK
ncbi:DegV family protein [Anaerolentibacter hominis]|uniref:DegV family protein n=1 Tax=Anaerolentibacter hominis TaxID=3079009 RepID=UPI0031B80619